MSGLQAGKRTISDLAGFSAPLEGCVLRDIEFLPVEQCAKNFVIEIFRRVC